MRPDAMILVFLIFSFKPTLSLSSFTLIKRLFSSFPLSAIRVVSSVSLRLLVFLPPTRFQPVTHPARHFSCVQHTYKTSKVTADSPVVLLSQSWTNPLFHTGFTKISIQAVPLHSFLNYHQFTYITEFWLLILNLSASFPKVHNPSLPNSNVCVS